MERELVKEVIASAPASAVWDTYGSLKLSKLSCELSHHMITKVEVLEGYGGVGTITRGWFAGGHKTYKDKIVKRDNEKRLKEVELIESALLNERFSLNIMRYEVIEKEADSCIIKTTIEYKVDSEARVPIVFMQSQFIGSTAATIGRHLREKAKISQYFSTSFLGCGLEVNKCSVSCKISPPSSGVFVWDPKARV